MQLRGRRERKYIRKCFSFILQNFNDPTDDKELAMLIASTPSLRVHPSRGYSELSVQQALQKLEDEYKEEYVRPNYVPYNRNMARQFPRSQDESEEEQKRKRDQAEASRLSRDKNKYFRVRMEQDIKMLTRVLRDHMARLVNVECYANEMLQTQGIRPVDWANVWDDDVSVPPPPALSGDEEMRDLSKLWDGDSDDDASESTSGSRSPRNSDSDDFADDDDSGKDTGKESPDSGDSETTEGSSAYDQCVIEPEITLTHGGDATIYESHGDDLYSGEDEF